MALRPVSARELIAQARAVALGKRCAVRWKKNCTTSTNACRMQYGTFRQGLFIGSGVVEAGCKTVIGQRCKQSGMFWRQRGAESVLAFRCIHSSRRLDSFWNDRLNRHAPKYDCPSLSS